MLNIFIEKFKYIKNVIDISTTKLHDTPKKESKLKN